MEEAIENFRKAKKRRTSSIIGMIFGLVLEAVFTAIGVTVMQYMILFLVIALIVGGCGVAVFFMENLKYNDAEAELTKLWVSSGMSCEEICEKAAELKVSKNAVEMFLTTPQEEEAEQIINKKKHKKEHK